MGPYPKYLKERISGPNGHMFPTIFALGLRGMGTLTKKASSFIVMGVAGGAFSPILMGYIGEANMAIGFVVPLISFIYILFYALKGYKL